MDCGAVQAGQAIEVEALQRFLVAEVGAPHAQIKLFLIAPGNLVMDQQAEEFGEGELAVDRFTVARFEGIKDAGQAQLFEQGSQFRDGMHDGAH